MSDKPKAEAIFFAALEKRDPAELDAFLDEACVGDPDLAQQVRKLLSAHDQVGDFLKTRDEVKVAEEARAPIGPNPTTGYRGFGEAIGSIVAGRYKLLQQIGEGGMGVVYMAEQEQPVRRRVALKIIKPGMDSGQVVARFEAERQALAMMEHQNIARVLDAGTTPSGRPYFVMELVHGVPITQFCDDNQLTPHERLELFVPVCQAIQHAHQKGIIHRDIKPSNVLVTLYDDKPVPKVIDFGVAKAIEQRLTEKTLFTQFGTLVGTFEYMSPEQAEMNAFGVDTRSDVYSLGVLLYELLTGTTPLERQRLRTAALDEVVRRIREEEPPRPSVRLSNSGDRQMISAARKMEPGRLALLVRGELDWIVMRSLEKNRARRYESASAFARDVERYLNDEAVEACPPSAGYRLRKFGRKNRALLTTAGAFAGLLLVATVISSWLAVAAKKAEGVADQARGEAVKELDRALAAEDGLERALARSLIAPLDPNGGDSLNQAELEALWQLAGTDNDRIRLHFLEEGLNNERMARQLSQRAELVIIALVGLDLDRRDSTHLQIMKILNEPGKSAMHKGAISWLGLEGAPVRSTTQRELCEKIWLAWPSEKNEARLGVQRQRLFAAAPRIEPIVAMETMIATLGNDGFSSLADGLTLVIERMDPAQSSRVCAQAAHELIALLNQEKNPKVRQQMVEGLVVLTKRIEQAEAILLCTQVAQATSAALSKERKSSACEALAKSLASVTSQMEPDGAASICSQAARTLDETLKATKLHNECYELAQALAAVAESMEPDEGGKLLKDALKLDRDHYVKSCLADGLGKAAGRMEPSRGILTLMEAISQCPERNADIYHTNFASSLLYLANRISPSQGVRILRESLVAEKDTRTRRMLTLGVIEVAERMQPTHGAKILNDLMSKEKDSESLNKLAQTLARVARRMEATDADRYCSEAAQILISALSRDEVPSFPENLAEGLGAVVDRMGRVNAERILSKAAEIIITALKNEKYIGRYGNWANGLDVVTTRMTPVEGLRILNEALNSGDVAASRSLFVSGLIVLAKRLDPFDGTRKLNELLKEEIDSDSRQIIFEALGKLAIRMDQSNAEQLMAAAARAVWEDGPELDESAPYAREMRISGILFCTNSDVSFHAAKILARSIVGYGNPNLFNPQNPAGGGDTDGQTSLENLLLLGTDRNVRPRVIAHVAAIGTAANGVVPCLSLLPAACDPLPCRFPTQELVELLKMPTCVGGVRQVILTQLSNRYGQRFASHWDFVEYAQEHKLNLDFTTPPQRPEAKLPPFPKE